MQLNHHHSLQRSMQKPCQPNSPLQASILCDLMCAMCIKAFVGPVITPCTNRYFNEGMCLPSGAIVHGACSLNVILDTKASCTTRRALAAWVTNLSVGPDGTGYALLKVIYIPYQM